MGHYGRRTQSIKSAAIRSCDAGACRLAVRRSDSDVRLADAESSAMMWRAVAKAVHRTGTAKMVKKRIPWWLIATLLVITLLLLVGSLDYWQSCPPRGRPFEGAISEAWESSQNGHQTAPPRARQGRRPFPSHSLGYPFPGCSPAEPDSVSPSS